ncbi:family 10 glycosylhydrolase, partial [Enterococcus casseliflavus]|uniref:family 10 glycosylhydrolase n=1 Tax=Enterococcus casseliflavus TaxID=37734 RepID=UPI003D0DD37C
MTVAMPEHAISYGDAVVMDPGATEVRDHVVSVIRDIVRRYDVDGIHFDDYFYPYPVAGETFDDAATYADYQASG